MKIKPALWEVGKILLLFVVFFGLMALTNLRMPNYELVNEYATSDVAYADGTTAHFENKDFGRIDEGDVATLHLKLPEKAFYDSNMLLFYDYNVVTEVRFGHRFLEAYGADVAAKDRMIGNRYFQIPIPEEAWGNEITITVQAISDNAISNFTNLRVYPTATAYQYFMDVDPIGFLCAIVFMVLGILGMFACIIGRVHGMALSSALCLISAMLLVSFWLFANEGIYTFFGLDQYFWQPLEYMAGYTIAIPLLLFYRNMTEKQSRWHHVFQLSAILVAGCFVVATILNFTNLLHYDSFMELFSLLLMGNGLLMLVYTIRMKTEKNRARVIMKMGMYVLLPCCIYEAFIRGLFKLLPLATIFSYHPSMALGIGLFFSCQVCAFFSDLYEKQKDLLTVQIKADTLNRVIDATPAGICQLIPDEECTIVSANNIFYKIMGYTDPELQNGKPLNAFSHLYENETEFLYKKIAEILQSPVDEGEFEFSTVDINDQPLTIIIRYYYDRTGSGNITVSLLDITDRKQMEEDLRMSEEMYKLALSQSGNEFFYFDIPTHTARLSAKIAEAFGLPIEVTDLPESFLPHGLLEDASEECYRDFFSRILAGEQSGETMIACHTVKNPKRILWYKLTFVSVFGRENNPMSTIITYEDVNDQYQSMISSLWKQQNLVSVPDKNYVIAVYDLTRNRLLSQTGELFAKLPEFEESYNGTNRYVLENFIHLDDVDALDQFLNLPRLLSQYEEGKTEDYIEYRSLQSGSSYRWTSLTMQMITDPYSGHIMAQLLFLDIDEEKSGQIAITQNMQNLQKELDNSRIKVMINQMQPHFLYNALSAIKMITRKDPQRAYHLIQDFTVHLRSSIHALSSDEPISFEEEMDNVRAYLNIERARFAERLHVVYDIQCECFEVIPLSIQPLVENAVKHGVFPKGKKGGIVTVRSYEAENAYIVEVEDDGFGFDVNKAMAEGNNSYGLKNIVFRLKALMQAEVVFRSAIGSGTLVTVFFPKVTQKRGSLDEDNRC